MARSMLHRHRVARALLCTAFWAGGLWRGCTRTEPVMRMTVGGSWREIGRQIGKKHAQRIAHSHSVLLTYAKVRLLRSRDALYKGSRELAAHIAPEDIEEMKGLADGANMPYEDVLFLNTFYNLAHNKVLCRQIALWGERTEGGRLIHGRNLDWFDYPGGLLRKNNLILNVQPPEGIEYLTLTWPGMSAVLTGTNRAGLTVAFNRIPTYRHREKTSEPVFFTLKRILRTCTTLDAAVGLLERTRPVGNGSVMISDARAGKAVVVEIVGERVTVRQGGDSMICNANYASGPGGKRPWWRPAEYPAAEVARRMGPGLSPRQVQRILGDRNVMLPINLLSVVFVPQDNTMHLSCGRYRAATKKFREYTLFEDRPAAPTVPTGRSD